MEGNKLTRGFGMTKLFLSKNADKIEFGAGLIFVGWGVFKLIKNADKIVEAKQKVEEVKENPESTKIKVAETAAVEYGKATGVGIGLTGVGLIFFGMSNVTLSRQIEVISAAAAATSASFNKYRQNVIADQGEAKDLEYLTADGYAVSISRKDDGTTIETRIPIHNPNVLKAYINHGVIFDEFSKQWEKVADYNHIFVLNRLNWLNQKLSIDGYLLENDIRDALGFEKSVAGQSSGIVYRNEDGTVNTLEFLYGDCEHGYSKNITDQDRSFTILFRKSDGTPLDDDITKSLLKLGWHLI